ncbi:hypothetical protein GCM10009733_108350 [Nonomuraea maheshkhaliensis]|uniref:Uncharacterized protein n=1 Tax=Nonomuraea maheshkhaliensis TaxID=419590 RepID=A0ABP4TY66_9ACTN
MGAAAKVPDLRDGDVRAVTSSPRRLWWRWTKAATLGEIAGFAVPAVAGADDVPDGPRP